MQLPTEKTKKRVYLHDLSILVHGNPKIGKSTFCSNIENALFLATEPGLNALDVYQIPIQTWSELQSTMVEIRKGSHEFKTIVIDTIDNAYSMCSKYICKKYGIEDASDLGYGKGFKKINETFQEFITTLGTLPYGLIMISHSQEKEFDSKRGKYTKIIPTLPGKSREIATSFVDFILYFDVELVVNKKGKSEYKRVIRSRNSQFFEAGCRYPKFPEVIELDFEIFKVEAMRAMNTSEVTNINGKKNKTVTRKQADEIKNLLKQAVDPDGKCDENVILGEIKSLLKTVSGGNYEVVGELSGKEFGEAEKIIQSLKGYIETMESEKTRRSE